MSAPLYQLAGEAAELQRRAEDGEDVGEALANLAGKIDVKAQSIAAVLRNLEADEEVLRSEEKRLSARRKAVEANRERLRAYLLANMVEAGIHRIKAPTFTISVSTREHVVVVDEAALPPEFVRTKVEPDRAAIQAAFKRDGEVVSGTRTETLHILTVR